MYTRLGLENSAEQVAAEAGIAIAFAANEAYEPALPTYMQNERFRELAKAAGELIGEGALGDRYLSGRHVAEEAAVLDWDYALRAKDVNLMPIKQKEEFKAVSRAVWETRKALIERFDDKSNYDDAYVTVRTRAGLVVAHAGKTGIESRHLKGQDNDSFIITAGHRNLDARTGMTMAVYEAIRHLHQHSEKSQPTWRHDKFETSESSNYWREPGESEKVYIHNHATIITGEPSPRGGYTVALGDGRFNTLSPDEVFKGDVRVPDKWGNDTIYHLGFRPAVLLDSLPLGPRKTA